MVIGEVSIVPLGCYWLLVVTLVIDFRESLRVTEPFMVVFEYEDLIFLGLCLCRQRTVVVFKPVSNPLSVYQR